jgi:acyl-CoA dehydrogenase
MPPAAAHLTRARVQLETLRGSVQSGLRALEAHGGQSESPEPINIQLALNFLKVEASELSVSVVLSAMRACGLAGYRNDGEFSMGRYLRDILSAPNMINNDPILSNAEAAVLMSDPPLALSQF